MGLFNSVSFNEYYEQKTIDFCIPCFNKTNIKYSINEHGSEDYLLSDKIIYADCENGCKISFKCKKEEYIIYSNQIKYKYMPQKTIDFCMPCFEKNNIKTTIREHGTESYGETLDYYIIYCECDNGCKISFSCRYSVYSHYRNIIKNNNLQYDNLNKNIPIAKLV